MDFDDDTGVSEEVIREAKNMGWTPKESFKGDPDHWVGADEFVERGRKVMPILTQNNKRLQRELLTRDQKIDTLQESLEQQQALLESLEDRYGKITQQAVADAKAKIRAELKQAREDDDIDAELDAQDRLRALDDVKPDPAPKKKEPTPTKKVESALSPEFIAWQQENAWYGQDKKKTKLMTRIAEDLRDEGNTLVGLEFIEECARVLEERLGETHEPPVNRVEGGGSRPRGSGGKGFADLPKEAKEACWSDVDELVGPGKRYKTQKDWEAAYAKVYFGS